MVKKIVLVFLALAVVFAIVVAMQPADFRIVRSATFVAPAGDVFAQVNDFHKWAAWSPWAKLDPAAKNSFEGPESGTGAIFRWAGNSEVGEGSMTILESKPNDLIKIKLDFLKPFPATNITEYTFKADGDKTVITWAMSGQNNFICKAIHLCMNIDKMVGGQFDEGLASMKAIVEANNKK